MRPTVNSKLPEVGLTIFSEMSALAQANNAINLSQGFPDFEVNSQLFEWANEAMTQGFNQYAPMSGIAPLREAIALKTQKMYGHLYDSETEITVTSGATEALFTAISCVVHPGDEVILFEPAYDSYAPAVKLCGGIVKFVPLRPPNYEIDWQKVERAVSPKTKLIVLNSPHNPTGSALRLADIEALSALCQQGEFFLLSDEVYEHIIFDGKEHLSLCRYPQLRERSLIVSSFGKTFHVTGWKIGYCLAPKPLSAEFRKIHQYLTFASHTPSQHAFARALGEESSYRELPGFYQKKRDYFLQCMQGSRFQPLPCAGTYFQLMDYSAITDEGDFEFAKRVTKEFRVATIPVSVFYHDHWDGKVLRFCFAKENSTLEQAADRLSKI